jgi:hypothetical protein
MIADAKPNLDVFHHLLYEINRGLRDLALYTIQPSDQELIQSRLDHEGVAAHFLPIEDGRVNVYFGHETCVNVVKEFGSCPHCLHTPEQDFILGIMLGYDRTKQCERYLDRREFCKARSTPCASSSECSRETDDIRLLNQNAG